MSIETPTYRKTLLATTILLGVYVLFAAFFFIGLIVLLSGYFKGNPILVILSDVGKILVGITLFFTIFFTVCFSGKKNTGVRVFIVLGCCLVFGLVSALCFLCALPLPLTDLAVAIKLCCASLVFSLFCCISLVVVYVFFRQFVKNAQAQLAQLDDFNGGAQAQTCLDKEMPDSAAIVV